MTSDHVGESLSGRPSRDHASGLFSSPLQRRAASACLIAVIVFELTYLYTGAMPFQTLARAAIMAFFVAALSRLGLREWLLGTLCLSLSAALLLQDSAANLGRALDQAAFLAAFVQTMGLLREAAVRSAAIRQVGAYLTRQPPGRRTLAILLGGHGMGLLLNFGALSLLGPLIQNGVRASSPDREIAEIRERRQLSALLRGFSWIIVWAPTTVTQALLLKTLPGANGAVMAGLGLATTALIFGIGWCEDQIVWRKTAARLRASGRVSQQPNPLPRRAFRDLAGICTLLLGTTLSVLWSFEVSVVPALMLTAPICLIVWTLIQHAPAGARAGLQGTGKVLQEVGDNAIPNSARECATLGAAGFIGVAAAALVPVEIVAAWLDVLQLHPALLLIALPLVIVFSGQFALSPIMMVVFLASIIAALPAAPADHTLIAFALSCGWAIALTASPNTAGALIMARVTGRGTVELTWRWNSIFSALAILLVSVLFALLVAVW